MLRFSYEQRINVFFVTRDIFGTSDINNMVNINMVAEKSAEVHNSSVSVLVSDL